MARRRAHVEQCILAAVFAFDQSLAKRFELLFPFLEQAQACADHLACRAIATVFDLLQDVFSKTDHDDGQWAHLARHVGPTAERTHR